MGSIRISCIGDFMPADTAYSIGNGISNKMPYLISHYSKVENQPFKNSDIVFCNLEAPLIKNPGITNLPFAGNQAGIKLMKNLGISVISVANNHFPDHGPEESDCTIQSLEENGFLPIGKKEENISNIAWLEINGKKIAFAAFNAINDHPEDKLVAPLERDILLNTLYEINKQSPDFTIFSFHWGNEYVTWPSPEQTNLAHEFIDKGVNIIIGHHPHVVQPVENYHGGIIIYSLGNFLFDMFWSKKVRCGMQIDLVLNEDKSINYEIKTFRIRTDFTQDYTENKDCISILEQSAKKLKLLQAGSPETYHKEYLNECKKRRLFARIRMKLYLLKNFNRLSSQSRELLFGNIRMKSGFLWKRN